MKRPLRRLRVGGPSANSARWLNTRWAVTAKSSSTAQAPSRTRAARGSSSRSVSMAAKARATPDMASTVPERSQPRSAARPATGAATAPPPPPAARAAASLFQPAMRALSTRLICPAPMPTVAPFLA